MNTRKLAFLTDSCKMPFGCWQLKLGPLEEQLLLLTTELSLQPHETWSFIDEGLQKHLLPLCKLFFLNLYSRF